jgi:hypothetical protein
MHPFFQKIALRVSGLSGRLPFVSPAPGQVAKTLQPLQAPAPSALNETMKTFFWRTQESRQYAIFFLNDVRIGRIPEAANLYPAITFHTKKVPEAVKSQFNDADTVHLVIKGEDTLCVSMTAEFYQGTAQVHNEAIVPKSKLFDLLGITGEEAAESFDKALAATPGYTAYAAKCVEEDLASPHALEKEHP